MIALYIFLCYNRFMKLAIIGSRSITSLDISKYLPQNINCIISGGAIGVDNLAEQYADTHNIPKLILKPDYKRYGLKAPLIRNKLIIDACDTIVAFWDGKSKGTIHAVDYAKSQNKKVVLYLC